VAVSFKGIENLSTRKKPSTRRQLLTNFSVTNNLIQNIAVMPEAMLNILTFNTNGQHSTWFYDKRDDCSFTITYFPQKSTIPTAQRMEFIFTPQPLLSSSLYSEFCQLHRILSTKLLNEECLKNRLILSFDHLVLNVRRPSPKDLV